MKIKLPFISLGVAVLVTGLFASCGTSNDSSGGTHNMGDNKNYKPMNNKDMPPHKSSGNTTSSGSHNMGDNKNYKPMPGQGM